MSKRILYHIFFIAGILCTLTAAAQQRTITGTVTDSKTGKPLVACTVYSLKTGSGIITDEKGTYNFTISERTDSIAISMVGYKTQIKAVTKEENQIINFQAVIAANAIEGVTVSAKSKYTRAQRLILKVIKNKPTNNIYESKTFQCREYDKVELDVKNIPEKLQKSRLLKSLQFALKNMDSTKDHQKYLPIYLSESTSDFYYSRNPERERNDYEALKTSGVPNQSILTYVDGLYKRVNVYNDNIKLVNIAFISPIADDALSFYNYHITDTLVIDGHRCIQVQFSRRHYGSNTFEGYLWIADSIYAIKSIVMHMDKTANINWVQKFELTQNFEPDSLNRFIPSRNELYVDLNIPAMKSFGAIARKTTVFKNVILNNDQIDTAFNKPLKDIVSVKVNGTDTAYWNNNRLEPLSKTESSVYFLVDTLRKIPIFIFYGKVVSALTTGYYTAGKIDWGNIYHLYTSNNVEGNRFNIGFKTNKFFSKKYQFNTYVGYSTKDEKIRYSLSTLFVLNKKPWSTFQVGYINDIQSVKEHRDELNENSLFASALRRVKDIDTRFVNSTEVSADYEKYFYDGWSFDINLSAGRLTPYFDIYYTHDGKKPYIVGQSGPVDEYKTNEAEATIRYAYKEKFITQNFRRLSLGSDFPIISFTYTRGIKTRNGFFGGDFNYDRYKLELFQKFTDGRLGRLIYTLQGGFTNGVLPILLLDVQKGNDTYYYDKYAFNNMNRYEFVADRYVSLRVQQMWGGFPFNHIPGIRKLKWRSLTTFNTVWGDMSEGNKVANGYYDTTIKYHFYIPNKTPYVEAGVGISNIFNVLRLDAVWRLTYRNNPDIPKFGLKGSLELKF